MNAPLLRDYPSKPALRRELARARELGIEVAGYEVAPGGVIRVLGTAAFPAAVPPPEGDFDRWRAQDQATDPDRERPARRP